MGRKQTETSEKLLSLRLNQRCQDWDTNSYLRLGIFGWESVGNVFDKRSIIAALPGWLAMLLNSRESFK